MSENPYPSLESWPRLSIAALPTPLQPLTHLRQALGAGAPRLLIKRDDLTGLALGGNKARKLEYLLADARAQGADTLVTCGAAQSNHALQTAAAGLRAGFAVRCVLYGAEPTGPNALTGNLRLHALLQTPLHWVQLQEGETRPEQALRRGLQEEGERVEAAGGKPYRIPTGGSTAIGSLGYVRAMQEARMQLTNSALPEVRTVYFASGSGGTQAGLMVGARLCGWQPRLVGVEVAPVPRDPEGFSPFQRAVYHLAQETGRLAGTPTEFHLADVELCSDYTGPAYGAPTSEAQEAIQLLAQTEGIFLDPVYTGKAFAALVGAIRAGRFDPDETVLFWHTGGVAGLFAHT